MRRALAVLLGLALALGALELGWRVVRTRGFGPTTNPAYVVRDDALGWRHRPLARARHRTADFDVEVVIGADGFRDATPPAADARPIVALGDSLTFGWGVEEREAFPAALERLAGVPVWNLGTSGYGTDQELLLFARAGAAARPRAVVVAVCGNDVEECARRAAYGRAKPFFPGPAWAPDACEPPAREPWIVRKSHLARSLAKARADRAWPGLDDAGLARARARVAGLLASLRDQARAAGAQLLVVREGEPWLAAALDASGVAHLDVAPALADVRPARFAGDPHWTAAAHAAVARAIAERLAAEGWLR